MYYIKEPEKRLGSQRIDYYYYLVLTILNDVLNEVQSKLKHHTCIWHCTIRIRSDYRPFWYFKDLFILSAQNYEQNLETEH
jgi:hypothetical protein